MPWLGCWWGIGADDPVQVNKIGLPKRDRSKNKAQRRARKKGRR